MTSKAAIALLFILSISAAQSQLCSLTAGIIGFCLGGSPCTVDLASLLLLAPCNGATGLNLTFPSSITINFAASSGSSLSVGALTLNGGASASASTTINFASAVAVANDLTVTGYALLNTTAGAVVTVGGKLQVAAGATVNIAGNLTVTGTSYVYGTIHLGGTIVLGTAQTVWFVAKSGLTVDGGTSGTAAITGNGGIDGSVSVNANVSINVGNSPGSVFINGDFSMSSTSTLTIDQDSDSSYDRLYINGKFSRNGILHVNLETSYRPDNGQSFIFATHGSSSGSFSISRGNLDSTLNKIHPSYADLSTSYRYGSAAAIAIPFALIALCLMGLVF